MSAKLIGALVAIALLIAAGAYLSHLVSAPKLALAKSDASQAHAVAAAQSHARTVEHKVAASDAAADVEYQKGLQYGTNQQESAHAALLAHIDSLRSQLAAAKRARGVPATDTSSGQRDGQAGADFLAAHGDDLIHLAGEADDTARQLSACQQLVTDRQGN